MNRFNKHVFAVEATYIKYKFLRRMKEMGTEITWAIRGARVIRLEYDPSKTYLFVLGSPYVSAEKVLELQTDLQRLCDGEHRIALLTVGIDKIIEVDKK